MLNRILRDMEWITPFEVAEWIATLQGWSSLDWQSCDNDFRAKWHSEPASGKGSLLAALDGELLDPSDPASARMEATIEKLIAESGADRSRLAGELRHDLQRSEAFREQWEWARRQLLLALREGLVAARGVQQLPYTNNTGNPFSPVPQSMPREAFEGPVTIESGTSDLNLEFGKPIDDEFRRHFVGWWSVEIWRADVLRQWPAPKPADARDVLSATAWTLLEVLAWIATRNADEVRDAERPADVLFQTTRMPGGEPSSERTIGEGPSLLRLRLQLSYAAGATPNRSSLSVTAAGDLLRRMLCEGRITAAGRRNGRGDPSPVPALDWEYLRFGNDHRGVPCARIEDDLLGGSAWYDLRFPVKEILAQFPADLAAIGAAHRRAWRNEQTARALYAQRIKAFLRDHGRQPTELEDAEWRKSVRIHRDMIRKLRRETAGPDRNRGGRRAKPRIS